jgi:Cdc6-like AAA superfamily ATPase
MISGKSGLMYLCGHPGTGKTSSLNVVLEKLKLKDQPFHLLMFNAMTFKDAKSFMIVLLKELESRLHTSEKKLLQRKNLTDDELAKKIAKTLRQLSEKT